MGKKLFIGVGNKAHRVKKIYLGGGGAARRVKKGFIGVNGKAQQFFSSGVFAEYHFDNYTINATDGSRNYLYLSESPGGYNRASGDNINCNGPYIGHSTAQTQIAGTVDSICSLGSSTAKNLFNVYKPPGLVLITSNVPFGGNGSMKDYGMGGTGEHIVAGNVSGKAQYGRYDRNTGAQLATSSTGGKIRGGSINEKFFTTSGELSAISFNQIRALENLTYSCDSDGGIIYNMLMQLAYFNNIIMDYATLAVIEKNSLGSGIKSIKGVAYVKGEYPL